MALTVCSTLATETPRYLQASASSASISAHSSGRDATPNEMTIPSTIGEEKRTNPFLRAPDAEELGRLRLLKDPF